MLLLKCIFRHPPFYSIKQPEAKKLRGILKIPGKHNISNSLAALAVARILKIPDKTTFKALSGYRGAWRRFETYKANFSGKNITIVSDYGHHPTQVKSTLQAAKEKYLYPVRSPRRGRGSRLGRLTFNGARRKIWIVYQPHQYLRTYYLFKDYVKAFDEADEIILPEIYGVAGREKAEIVRKLSSKNLKEAIEKRFKKAGKTAKIHFLKDFMRIPQFLKSRLKNNDVVILMGAGDIYKLVSKFLEP